MRIWKKAVAILLASLLIMAAVPGVSAAENRVETNSLRELLITASAYKQKEYTEESWNALQAAIGQAMDALDSDSQKVVDDAYTALALAIFGLVKMNYSALDEALADANVFLKDPTTVDHRQEIQELVTAAKALYSSCDQPAINEAAASLTQRVAQLREYIQNKAKLEEMLEVAGKVDAKTYTAESWQALQDAAAQARAALEDGGYEKVSEAVSALAKALKNVSNMDYSALDGAIANAEEFLKNEELADYWQDFQKAIDDAKNMYTSVEQTAVNNAAQMLNLRVEELQAVLADSQSGVSILWIVLLGISLAGNIALAVLLWCRKRSDRGTQVDDVPLVDYDIDDDIV